MTTPFPDIDPQVVNEIEENGDVTKTSEAKDVHSEAAKEQSTEEEHRTAPPVLSPLARKRAQAAAEFERRGLPIHYHNAGVIHNSESRIFSYKALSESLAAELALTNKENARACDCGKSDNAGDKSVEGDARACDCGKSDNAEDKAVKGNVTEKCCDSCQDSARQNCTCDRGSKTKEAGVCDCKKAETIVKANALADELAKLDVHESIAKIDQKEVKSLIKEEVASVGHIQKGDPAAKAQSAIDKEINFEKVKYEIEVKELDDPPSISAEDASKIAHAEARAHGSIEKGGATAHVQSLASKNAQAKGDD